MAGATCVATHACAGQHISRPGFSAPGPVHPGDVAADVLNAEGRRQVVLPLHAPALAVALGRQHLLPRPGCHAEHLRCQARGLSQALSSVQLQLTAPRRASLADHSRVNWGAGQRERPAHAKRHRNRQLARGPSCSHLPATAALDSDALQGWGGFPQRALRRACTWRIAPVRQASCARQRWEGLRALRPLLCVLRSGALPAATRSWFRALRCSMVQDARPCASRRSLPAWAGQLQGCARGSTLHAAAIKLPVAVHQPRGWRQDTHQAMGPSERHCQGRVLQHRVHAQQ